MRITHLISILLSIVLFSCNEKEDTKKPEETQISKKAENVEAKIEPNVDVNEIESDFMTWWTYHYNTMSLSSNFIALNEQSDTIGKKEFLEKLITTHFIPLKIKSDATIQTYKLFKLSSQADKKIGNTIKNESLTSLQHFNMEGVRFPEFNFTDLQGNIYTNETIKGKTIIVKTWFINCKACIAEFPELNEFVEKHQQRNDLIFLSLALDTESKLKEFLQKKDFNYQVIANQRDFIEKKLSLQLYPTHIIVDKNGSVTKVVNKASEMISFFENEQRLRKKMVPPPPPM